MAAAALRPTMAGVRLWYPGGTKDLDMTTSDCVVPSVVVRRLFGGGKVAGTDVNASASGKKEPPETHSPASCHGEGVDQGLRSRQASFPVPTFGLFCSACGRGTVTSAP